jgi:V/A-type H+/Na+-transporting ATPase subunit E
MTGLEKILGHIEEDATCIAENILKEAEKEAKEIMAQAQAAADKKCFDIIERSKLDIMSSLNRAESAANLQEKKLILNAKQEIISNLINKARDTLINLPDKDYFDTILLMLQKNALASPGSIAFSNRDLKRLPEGLIERINFTISKNDGANLKLNRETCNIDGGFILTYGDVEINCSFEALFAAARETLQDKVCEALFE